MGEKVAFYPLTGGMYMFLFKLTGETPGEIFSDAGLTIVIGLVVVFGVLLLLTAVFKIFGVIMSGAQKKEEEVAVAPAVAPASVAAPAPVVDLGPIMSSAQVRNGIEPEVTAVIAAAVACSMPAGQKYSITKIDLAD